MSTAIVAIMGSGETSPTMVTVHRKLVDRLPAGHRVAVLLETPYAFQTNADDVSAKARRYFAHSVGLEVVVVPGTGADRELAALRSADWVFAGPGSPSYALRRWRHGPVERALHDRVRSGSGITVLASAAAAAMGRFAVPVYEIYKAGEVPHWLDGLDLLAGLGLPAAVIPHFDNTEGGTYDTRFCYLGEERLAAMERQLPAGTAVLGVDEHTAVLIDLRSGAVEVTGRGALTVRRDGHATVLPGGTAVSLADLVTLARDGTGIGVSKPATVPIGPSTSDTTTTTTLRDIVTACERQFDAAGAGGSAVGMSIAICTLEKAIHEWGTDTDEDDGTEQARAVLRSLVVRLGETARDGLCDPRERLGPTVDALVALRGRLRAQQAYAVADAIRDALHAGGVALADTDTGSTWSWSAAPSPPTATR
jgi:hypothetical protein